MSPLFYPVHIQTLATSNEAARDVAVGFESIDYEICSKYVKDRKGRKRRRSIWPMQDCHHLMTGIDSSQPEILLTQAHSSVAEGRNPACNFRNYEFKELTLASNLKLTGLDPFGLSCADGMNGLDPYLPIGSSAWYAKIGILDRIALDTFVPKLDTGFSLPVFIFEIAELKQLWQEGFDLLRFLFDLPFGKGGLKTSSYREILRSSWLSTNLCWLPFVSDVKKLVELTWNLGDDIEAFIAGSGKRKTLHHQWALSPLTFQDEEFFADKEVGLIIDSESDDWEFADQALEYLALHGHVKTTMPEISYHATITFTYNIPSLGNPCMPLLAVMDRYGCNRSLQDLWEVIPFSFVVDYFLNIGSWLGQFDIPNVPVQVVIHDYCRSIKYLLERRGEIDALDVLVFPGQIPENVDYWTPTLSGGMLKQRTSGYYRVKGSPRPEDVEEALPHFTFPSGKQWITNVALLK